MGHADERKNAGNSRACRNGRQYVSNLCAPIAPLYPVETRDDADTSPNGGKAQQEKKILNGQPHLQEAIETRGHPVDIRHQECTDKYDDPDNEVCSANYPPESLGMESLCGRKG
jgi:hypothetical protein